jgi:hypothetical protein
MFGRLVVILIRVISASQGPQILQFPILPCIVRLSRLLFGFNACLTRRADG